MKCNDVMQKFMEADDYRILPLNLRLHLFFCRKCRRESQELAGVFDSLLSTSPYKAPSNLTASIMSMIFANTVYNERKVSGFKWVTAGTVIFSSILLINFSETFIMLKEQFGSLFTIPMSIVLGIVITGYSAILIGCNYEDIKEYIDHFNISRH